MSVNVRFSWVFKLACASMFSFVALGAKYGHKGRLEEDGLAWLHKAQIYHLTNSTHSST